MRIGSHAGFGGRRFWAPVILALAVWALHAAVAWRGGRGPLSGDEPRYWKMAENLSRGGFASRETRLLWNGPGYPLTLVPWVAAGAEPVWPRLMNAVWMVVAALGARAWFRVLALPHAEWHAGALAVYALLHGSLSDRLMSECLSMACVTWAAWGYARGVTSGLRWHSAAVMASALAGLALTKVFFGYALAGVLALLGAALAAGEGRRRAVQAGAVGVAAALALCLPYLAGTYRLTGKVFYWGNSGGAQLYCLTLPEARFLGDWLNSDAVIQDPEFYGAHSRFYASIDTLDFVAQDEALRAAAWRHVLEHPAKVFANWRANVNRMVLGQPVTAYPGASAALKSGNRAMVQGLWFYAVWPSLWVLWRRRRGGVGAALVGPVLFCGMSLAGLSLLSSEPRMVFPLLPLLYALAAWAAYATRSMRPPTPGGEGERTGGEGNAASNC